MTRNKRSLHHSTLDTIAKVLCLYLFLYSTFCIWTAKSTIHLSLLPFILFAIIYASLCVLRFKYAIYALIYSIPLQYTGINWGFIISITDVMILCLLGIWVLRKLLGEKTVLSYSLHSLYFLLLFFIFCLLSLKETAHLANSLRELLRILAGVGAFLVAYDKLGKREITEGLQIFLIASIIVSLRSLWEFILTKSGMPLIEAGGVLHTDKRVSSILSNPNRLAAYVGIAIPVAIYCLYISRKLLISIYFSIVLLLNAICLILTFSKAGYICVLVSLFFFVKKKKFFIILLSCLVLVFFASGFHRFIARSKGINNRYKLYLVSIQYTLEKPFWGHGLREFKNLTHYKDESIQGKTPHSMYAKLAVETGMGGLLSFLAFLFFTFRNGVWSIRKNVDFYEYSYLLAIFASVFLFKFFQGTIVGLSMWIMLGIYQKYPIALKRETG